jgi:hypothetical protein
MQGCLMRRSLMLLTTLRGRQADLREAVILECHRWLCHEGRAGLALILRRDAPESTVTTEHPLAILATLIGGATRPSMTAAQDSAAASKRLDTPQVTARA